MRSNHSSLVLTAAVAASLGLIACSQGGQVNLSARAISDSTATAVPLPPPMNSANASLMVTIDQVKVHLAGSEAAEVEGPDKGDKGDKGEHGEAGNPGGEGKDADREHDEADEDGGSWVIVFQGAQAIDLLDAKADAVFLGSITVPAGRITQVRLVLGAPITLVLDGKSFPITCSACTGSGVKVVIPGGVLVKPGESLDLSLDVDARASLVIDTGSFRLVPVIHIVANHAH